MLWILDKKKTYEFWVCYYDWKTAYVTLLVKKDDSAKASNYQLVCCKIIEHVIHSHVINHPKRNSIMEGKQNGVRKRRSNENTFITTIIYLGKGLNDKQQIYAALLGFGKTFDKVSRRKLTIMECKETHLPGYKTSLAVERSK